MDNMTFEQAEQLLTPAQKDRIARCLWEDLKLPQGLNEVEKAFAFGLYTFVQYEDKGALRSYFVSEASQAEPEQPAPAPRPSARNRLPLLLCPSRSRSRLPSPGLPCQNPRLARTRV